MHIIIRWTGTYDILMQQASAFNWNFIVYDVHNATYSSHWAPWPARDLFPWLNTRVKVHISVWTIREYPKRHSSYLSVSEDTFLPLTTVTVVLLITCTRIFWIRSFLSYVCDGCGTRQDKLIHFWYLVSSDFIFSKKRTMYTFDFYLECKRTAELEPILHRYLYKLFWVSFTYEWR